MIEPNELVGRARLPGWGPGAITGELTRGVLTAMGGLVAVAILVLLTSFVISAVF
jgi:hypothetical protein